jgi:hypothetical protein
MGRRPRSPSQPTRALRRGRPSMAPGAGSSSIGTMSGSGRQEPDDVGTTNDCCRRIGDSHHASCRRSPQTTPSPSPTRRPLLPPTCRLDRGAMDAHGTKSAGCRPTGHEGLRTGAQRPDRPFRERVRGLDAEFGRDGENIYVGAVRLRRACADEMSTNQPDKVSIDKQLQPS